MRRVTALVPVLLVAAGLCTTAGPVRATNVCAGQGTFTSGALYYPVTANTGPQVTVQQPPWVGWAFSITLGTCAPNLTKGMSATGVLNGWCGLFSASGTTSNGYRFTMQNVGSVLLFTGGLNGIGSLQPDVLGGQSCLSGATGFLIQLAVVKASCGLLKHKFLTTLPVPIPATLSPLPGGLGSVHTNNTHVWSKLCVGFK